MVASHGLQKGHKNVCKRGIKIDVNQAEVGAFRSGYMCTSVGMRVYLGRGTCVPRSERDDQQVSLTRHGRILDILD